MSAENKKDLIFLEEAGEISKEAWDSLKIKGTSPGEFNGILRNIKQSIEFCMEYQIDKDPYVPKAVIDKLAGLHVELMEYLK